MRILHGLSYFIEFKSGHMIDAGCWDVSGYDVPHTQRSLECAQVIWLALLSSCEWPWEDHTSDASFPSPKNEKTPELNLQPEAELPPADV